MALGILIPMLFHAAGLGPVFLPMFWPMAMGGFFLPAGLGAVMGGLTPLLSSMMTGMPPVPTLYKMMVELAVLAGVVSILYQKTVLGTFWITAAGLASSLVAGWFGALAVALILGLPPALYAAVSLLRGLPGIAAMLIMLPVFFSRFRREPIFTKRSTHAADTQTVFQ